MARFPYVAGMRIILNTGAKRASSVLVAMLCAAFALTACSASNAATDGKNGRVRVVAAENFWGSIARQVGGADADVRSIISNPDADPHDYEPTAHDARTIASAQLVIENGIGYDPWADQLLRVDSGADRTVLDVGDVTGVADGGNPHQWYSSASVAKFVDRVASDLARVDPAHAADYRENARKYETHGLAEYNALLAEIRRRYGGTPIGASESVVTLLAESAGLSVATPA